MSKKTRYFRTALPEDFYIITEDEEVEDYVISKFAPGSGSAFAVEQLETGYAIREEFKIKYNALIEIAEMASLEGEKHCLVVYDLDNEIAIRTSAERIKPFDRVITVFNPNDYFESAKVLYDVIPDLLEERVGDR